MAKYRVTSICIDCNGTPLKPVHPSFDAKGLRREVIDTTTNVIFKNCRGPWDVEDAYEAFWNRLNPSWEREFPVGKERVKVVKVEEVTRG